MADIDFEKGGTARLIALTKDTVTLLSTVPSPPGSRIEGTLRASADKVRFKIHASKKQADGTFLLEGRPIDLTRELRERLEQAVASAT